MPKSSSRQIRRLLTLCAALALTAAATPAHAQPTLSKVFTPSTIGPGSVSTITFTITNGSASPVTGLSFTDTLPAAITIADPANAATDCDLGLTGSLTAPDGGSTITLSDAQIGGSQSCTVTVDVTASTPGMHTNPAITLSSSAGSSMSLAIDLTVDTGLPGFSKSFAPSSVSLGGKSTLTFLIDNTANASPVPNLDFTDNLPAGMAIASPANASTTCGTALIPPTLTAAAGTTSIVLDANGTASFPAVAAGATCTVTVDVVTTGAGMLDNLSGELLAEFVSAGKASDTLEVTVTPLAIQKAFTDDPVPPGGTVTLEFRIDNFDRIFAATGVAFTDDLTTLVPALPGLTFASVLFDDCLGTTSIGGGGTTLSLTGGTIAAEGFCTIRVSLSVPAGATPGSYTNTSGAVTASVDGSPVVGNTASDELFVEPVPLLTKEFLEDGTLNPDPVVNPGDDVVIRFTVTNTSATSGATDIAFLDDITSFFPFGGPAVLPATPCGAGSSIIITSPNPGEAILSLADGSLAAAGMAGDSCSFDLTLTLPASLGPGIYTNTTEEPSATVDGATRTGEPASDTFTVVAAPSLSKSFTDDPVAPGGTVTLEFTLSYSPDASGDATGITFTDDIGGAGGTLPGLAAAAGQLPMTGLCPAGDGSLTGSVGDTLLTFSGATLMPGEDCTFSVTLDVPVGAAPGTYPNTTSGVGASVDGVAATSAPAEDDLDIAGLIVTKEFLGDPVIAGDTVTLRFTLENVHPTDAATSIRFTDDLAAVLPGLPDITSTGAPMPNGCGGSETGSSTFLDYQNGSLTAGMTCTVDYEILVPAGAADGAYNNTTGFILAIQSGGSVFPDDATDTLTIESNLLQLSKAFTDDPVAPGDTVTLEFTLTNLDAGNPASMIDFDDDFGAVLSGVTFDSEDFNDCGAVVAGLGTDMISVTGASLGMGGSCTLRFTLTVPPGAAAGIYPNTTSDLTGDIGGFAVTGDAANDELEVIQLLGFSKSFDGPTTATGTAILTFTITNPGTDTATDIAFTDNLDDVISGLIATSLPAVPCGAGSEITGIGFLTFSGGTLPPLGGMCSFDVEVLVPASATAGTFPNVTSDLFRSGLVVGDPATADLTIEPPPTFTKVFMPDAILAGGTSTLRFTIDNSASALAASNLAFMDSLPAGVAVTTPANNSNGCGGSLTATAGSGTIMLTGGSVAAGATCTLDVDVTSVVSGAHVNTTGDLTSTSGNSGFATDTLTVSPSADLSVTKTDGVTSATPGGSVTYTIVVTNPGPSADPSVGLADVFPSPPLTCTYTSVAAGGATGNTAGAGDLAETLSMPAGSSVTYTVSCDIASDATGTLSNTATITPSITDTNPGNNSATDDDTVLLPEADLEITKSDGVTSAVPGESVTYTIVATNNGLSDDPSVSVADTFPAELTCTYTSVAAGGATGNTAAGAGDIADTLSMPAGSSVTYTVDCTIDQAATGTLSNTATISGSVTDPTPGNNSATDGDTVLMPETDLSITKDDSPDPVVAGETLTYTITVTNDGPSDSTGATVTDVLPGGVAFDASADCNEAAGTVTCDIGALAVGAGQMVSFTVTVDPGQTATISNTATVAADETDPNAANDSATAETTVEADADLGIVKDGPAAVTVGEQLTYTLTVTNNGPSTAVNVSVDDPTPAGLTFISATAPCAGGFPCDLGTMAPDDEIVVDVTFEVPFDYAGPPVIVNTATVSSDTADGVPGNDSDTAETDVSFDTVPPEVTGVATDGGPLAECDTVRVPVTVIEVSLEDDQSPIVNAGDVSSYLLVEAGPDRDFSTGACGGPAGDDVQVPIVNVTLTDTPPTALAELNFGAVGLGGGLYRLLVCDTIEDAAGNALDGDGDAVPGGDFVLSFFRADPLNLFENGHFDDCPVTLAPWLAITTAPNTITPGTPGADDFESSPLSASSRVSHSVADPSTLAQCVEVEDGVVYDLVARWRFDPPMGAVAVLEQTCELFDSTACTGVSLGSTSSATLLEDGGGVWEVIAGEVVAAAGAVSALCDFAVQPAGPDPNFDLYLDALSLTTDGLSSTIFTDGFESGDTSAWSSTQP